MIQSLCAGDEHPPAVCCGGQQRVCEGWQQEPASQAISLGCRPGAYLELGWEGAISFYILFSHTGTVISRD
jgi:hypothetical protein